MIDALVQHWPEYLIEGGLLGAFMVSACVCTVLVEHPSSPLRRRLAAPLPRRALIGLAMGMTAAALIYSPWGRQSGAHMNPATTLTFLFLGKIAPWDAAFYAVFQTAGGALGVAACALLLRRLIAHESVNYAVTVPGRFGIGGAFAAEVLIAFAMMFAVLRTANDPRLMSWTGLFAAGLVALFITVEAPWSGMSMNPARTFASAVCARRWTAFWVYVTAPLVGMGLAAVAHTGLPGANRVYCAKLDHGGAHRCIFDCDLSDLLDTANVPSGGPSSVNAVGR